MCEKDTAGALRPDGVGEAISGELLEGHYSVLEQIECSWEVLCRLRMYSALLNGKNRFEYDPLAKWHEIAKFAKQSKIM